MRGKLKKALSLLCVFLLVLSSTVIVPNASGEELNPDAAEVERDYDPETNNGAKPDSGLFIITGTDDSLGAAPVSGETGLTLVFIPVKNSANGEQAGLDALLAALNDTAAVRRDNPVNAVIAARGKIVTRLDALKEYVLSYMDVESLRDAWDLEAPPQSMLEEAEQILSDLREIDSYAGLEEAVA